MRRFSSLAWLLVVVFMIPARRGQEALSYLLTIAAIRSAAEVNATVSVACLIRLHTSFSFDLSSNSCKGSLTAFSTN